ncbi:fatty acyl-CoA reductase wat-like isoform X1 [Neodiprion pinetum]|uniref:fatty acyl-CoA reductase wat-like isoform X1 n=1 Tax=Neodiprion pinetum TaxID=441929 RepID=UPI001EDCAFBE|nr:fatty acyl-CoA reductase wat-like isoform X1 [Neodiprion pinetum]
MSQASYIRDMLSDSASDQATGPSEVASFYAHTNILLTGGAGFLGKLLTERILRSCPEVSTLFLLLRAKKGKSPQERFAELFDDLVFDRLKKEKPGFAQKVRLIEGDVGEIGLGLAPEQRELLRTTNIVIHGAATVRFDESVRIATKINVRGTKEMLILAKEMPNLRAFVHISTAYSNCVRQSIDEKFYPPPIDSDKLLDLVEILDDASLEHLTPVLLGKYPNTYVFTKAVAEDVIRRNSHSLPVCIVRPSIVIATYKEPVAGWIDNVYGTTGVVLGAAIGLLRTLHCDPEGIADMIPADFVVNNIIVAAWDIAEARTTNVNSADSSNIPETDEPPIYNVVSSCQKPFRWGELMRHIEEYGLEVPSMMCIWYYCFKLNKYESVHKIYVIFLHLLPALIVDSVARIIGREPMLWKAYKKIHKFSAVISYFATQQWRFSNNGVLRLSAKLNPADQNQFKLNMKDFSWEEFNYNYVRGGRLYLLKDPLDTVPKAAVRYARLRIIHYAVVTVMWGMIFWLLWTLVRFLGLW